MNEKATAQRIAGNVKKIVFRFPATDEAPARARDAAESLLQDSYPDLIETTRLLISELVTNSVRHGRLNPDHQVEVMISTFDNGVKIDVVDSGVGFEYQPRKGALGRVGGWGLYMVEQLSHRWGVAEGLPTTVWFELQRPSNTRSFGVASLFI